jgi:magnesium chelatase subunit D
MNAPPPRAGAASAEVAHALSNAPLNSLSNAPSNGLSNALAAAIFAVDPVGLGGVRLRSAAGSARDAWLAALSGLLPPGTPWRRVPLHINEDRLLGGLDLPATLQAGRPIAQRGLLAEADGGIVLLAMAERLTAATAAHIATVLDTAELVAERHGIGARSPSRLGVVALDEGLTDDEQVPARLRERLAFHLTLEGLPSRSEPVDGGPELWTRDDVAAARARLAGVRLGNDIVEGLCAAALALGVDSVRAPLFACRAASAAAALDGRSEVSAQDAALAAGLVLAARATRLPAQSSPPDSPAEATNEAPEATTETEPEDLSDETPGEDTSADPPDTPPPSEAEADAEPEASRRARGPVDDVVLEAALAAMPKGLLAALVAGSAKPSRAASAGRVGAARMSQSRGRPTGVRRGEPQGGARLNLIETLRAAAPWQSLRRRESAADGCVSAARIQVRREDFHVWRFKQRSETTTVFVVDASGSSALNRLAEAKGAVELLLADCYVRRDSVAVIAFRGAGAELLLPPTRSLVRAKRGLAGLPGGGGTPLAAGIAAALALADAIRRKGATPVVVLLTDGRANIARDGAAGRAPARDDALAVARQMRAQGFSALLLDTSPQPQEPARQLAVAMGARYLPLPYAGAATLSQAVRAAGVAAAPAASR